MKTELAKKDNGIKELQTQLSMTKMETQVQQKQLMKRKEVMAEENKLNGTTMGRISVDSAAYEE